MIYLSHPRSSVIENVEKMIHCGAPSFDGAMYACPTCGNLYAMQRTTSMSFQLVHVVHRHCVFTIDENLRKFFLLDHSLLD